MSSFFKSKYTISDLEQFRDKNGFMDLTKAGIEITEETREILGNANRVKNWVDFNGQKALIKGEALCGEEKNYGMYAELIVEEIAKQLGIESAHYDLIKITDENGEEVHGVLSESVVNKEKEQLVTLRDIIGDEPQEKSDFPDTTTYKYTIDKLREGLKRDGYSEENIETVILNYKKSLMFTLCVLDADKHTENVAFIKSKEDGEDKIRFSPNYDSESALMLDNNISIIDKLLGDYMNLKESVDTVQPRIGTLRKIEDGGYGWLWKDTLEELCEDDELFDYYANTLKNKVDMDIVLDNVEERIKAKLPENVRLIAKYSYNIRSEEIEKVMNGEISIEQEDEEMDFKSLLNSIIYNGAKKEKIRTGEQLQVGKSMEKDLQEEMSLDDLMDKLFNDR